MRTTNEIAESQELDNYLKKNKKYYEITFKKMKLLVLDKTMELHPYEELIFLEKKILFISPRGIDFFQEVLLPGLFEIHNKKLKHNKTNYKNIFNELDKKWTDKWIQYFSDKRLNMQTYFFETDIPLKQFYKTYDIKSTKFHQIITNHPELKKMIYKIGNKNYLKQKYISNFMMDYFREMASKRISLWIKFQPEDKKQKYYDIKIKEFPEMENQKIRKKRKDIERIKVTANKKIPQLIPVKSNYIHIMGIAELEMIKEELQDWHPHEKMIYKVWDTEKEIAGETYFTLHGANWYAQVYLPLQNQKSNVFFHQNEEKYKYEKMFMERMLQKENVDQNSLMDEMPSTMRHLYQFRDIEHMQNVFKMLGIEKEIYELKKEDYQILEKEYPEMQIRRYSYLYSQTKGYQESIVQYVNPVKVPKRNVEWLEIESSEPGWYYGRIINRHYFYGKGKKEVLTLNVQLDNGKKIKVRYPQVINRKTAISLMFEAGVPIRFEIEKIKINGEDHKRLKQIVLMKQIGFILDWRECEMQYVPIPEIGRKPKIK